MLCFSSQILSDSEFWFTGFCLICLSFRFPLTGVRFLWEPKCHLRVLWTGIDCFYCLTNWVLLSVKACYLNWAFLAECDKTALLERFCGSLIFRMSEDNQGFVAWEEHIVCHERGNRVIHFYLKDVSGESVLAVIGTERSIRHMTYVVSDELMRLDGFEKSVIACTKWRARREVVDWLTSLVSRHRVPYSDISSTYWINYNYSFLHWNFEVLGFSLNGINEWHNRLFDQI